MLPSKKLTPQDVLLILRRRIWLILLPLALVSSATAVVARHLPDRFRSETVILVVPQRIPESYVKATVSAKIEDRLQSISQQILSRTRLERIIQDFNLYAAQRQTSTMENTVERMRADIDVQVVKSDAFRVAYVGDNARTVMQVTDRLASLFIEENLRDREVLAESTNRFLETQVEDARRQLIQREKKLEEYRKRFSGELPSQLPTNLQIIQNIQMQIQALVESINRDRDRRLLVERQLHEAEREIQTSDPPRFAAPPVAVASPGPPSATASQKLASAHAELAAIESRLTPNHPEVQRMHRLIRELELQVQAEARDKPVDSNGEPTERSVAPTEVIRTERASDLRAELQQLDRQLEFKNAEDRRLRALVDSYQQRLERQPTRESELAEITRDYSTLQSLYDTLLTKQEESRIAANLERRQIGEQFKLLDPARMAEKPFSPNRHRMTLLGMAVGLALGLGLIALLEYNDRAFKNDTELVKELALPVLAVVPLMASQAEQRRGFRRRLFLGCGLGTVVAACLSVVIYSWLN